MAKMEDENCCFAQGSTRSLIDCVFQQASAHVLKLRALFSEIEREFEHIYR